MKIYLVGGAVRDKVLGIKSKDLDYVVVLDSIEGISAEQGFKIMEDHLVNEGYKIFVSHPQHFTIRAKFPKNHKNSGQDADFVLARKEIGYTEDSREPILVLGTLLDDLERRDFTVNAIAMDIDGNYIDPFMGIKDIELKILFTPLDPMKTFADDPLRVLRAMRFHITKGFAISPALRNAMRNPETMRKFKKVVSKERTREELLKMLKFDTINTVRLLVEYDEKYFFGLLDAAFDGMWLEPTMKKL